MIWCRHCGQHGVGGSIVVWWEALLWGLGVGPRAQWKARIGPSTLPYLVIDTAGLVIVYDLAACVTQYCYGDEPRDACAKPGTIWALLRAFSGSQGTLRRHVCVDLIFSPSGRLMTRGVITGLMSVTGVPGNTKCPVAPASAITWSPAMLMTVVLYRVSCGGGLRVFAEPAGFGVGLVLVQLLMTTVSSSSSSGLRWLYGVLGWGSVCNEIDKLEYYSAPCFPWH
jgi:hypothetical protein